VLTINCYLQGATEECCYYQIRPDPNAEPPGIYAVSCADELFHPRTGTLFVSRTFETRLVNRRPTDGAVDQSLDTKLNCTIRRCDCLLCPVLTDVYFGTNPDPPVVAINSEIPYDPGQLEPNTTYYWKIKTYGPGTTMSPVWSFTTTSGVPTESTSWGAIKALYTE
jgi:hypothetical protein